jgi:flagella basal body P-ring formation protein FlgA
MRMDRLDRVGLSEANRVIGQRAKRYLPAGSMIVLRDLESVPLVERGQLVTVESSVGGTVIRTVAKAIETGSLGDKVELRSTQGKRRQMFGTVTGPRRVVLVSESTDTAEESGLAWSGKEN